MELTDVEGMRSANEDMGRFFSIYDGDGSESLDKTELSMLLEQGTGRQWGESRVGQLIENIDGDGACFCIVLCCFVSFNAILYRLMLFLYRLMLFCAKND